MVPLSESFDVFLRLAALSKFTPASQMPAEGTADRETHAAVRSILTHVPKSGYLKWPKEAEVLRPAVNIFQGHSEAERLAHLLKAALDLIEDEQELEDFRVLLGKRRSMADRARQVFANNTDRGNSSGRARPHIYRLAGLMAAAVGQRIMYLLTLNSDALTADSQPDNVPVLVQQELLTLEITNVRHTNTAPGITFPMPVARPEAPLDTANLPAVWVETADDDRAPGRNLMIAGAGTIVLAILMLVASLTVGDTDQETGEAPGGTSPASDPESSSTTRDVPDPSSSTTSGDSTTTTAIGAATLPRTQTRSSETSSGGGDGGAAADERPRSLWTQRRTSWSAPVNVPQEVPPLCHSDR